MLEQEQCPIKECKGTMGFDDDFPKVLACSECDHTIDTELDEC